MSSVLFALIVGADHSLVALLTDEAELLGAVALATADGAVEAVVPRLLDYDLDQRVSLESGKVLFD